MNAMLINKLYFFTILYIIANAFAAEGNGAAAKESLPYCNESSDDNRLIIVSTLDGKLTALNPANGGTIAWSIHPGDAPMLSSSIDRLELSNYGQLIRMIPSLSGGLYKFNGETVEAIPLTADHLLHASFRYSDDLVMSGGRESQTIGVSLQTGKIIYDCSMRSGCREEAGSLAGDVLVVQRQGQVVRAVEPRTGVERWNFSVAQHDLKLISECHQIGNEVTRLSLKVVIPEGLVCAVDSSSPSKIAWKHKFESPVVSTWEVSNGKLYEIDLFSSTAKIGGEAPGIYIGMHEKQLYIQESVTMLKKREELTNSIGQNLLNGDNESPQLPWRPVAASVATVGLIETDEETAVEEMGGTALSVMNAAPVINGHGFFLYSDNAVKTAQEELCNVTVGDNTTEWVETDEDTPQVIVVIGSLWHWWKEVSIISITTALIFNWVFTRGYFRFRSKTLCSLEEPKSRSDSGVILEELPRSRNASESDYISRYLSDFDTVRCLGRGGFGVVFEAKNKIDDCHYAIKRISLPDAAESRDRVLREVRALAKLDHQNIVRYFNSWLESPPPGFEMDQKLPSASFGETESAALSPIEVFSESKLSSVAILPPRDCEPSDSFIVFATNSQSEPDDLAIVLESETETETGVTNSTKSSFCLKSGVCSANRTQASAVEWCRGRAKVYLYIQMQLCQRKSLKEWLRENQTRDYEQVLHIFDQIVMAVEYVHLRNLIHRDLKPSNIFFSLDDQIKIGDFGLVATMDDEVRGSPAMSERGEGHTAQVGTQLYMSPEQLAGKSYNFKVDIFSLGLILFELLVPFSTEMERLRVLTDVKKHCFPREFMDNHKHEHQLLQVMLSHSPDERPTTLNLRSRPPLLQEDVTT